MTRFVVCFLLLGAAIGAEVSPVGKVVELLEDLKAKVEKDLAAEGKAMEEYTTFCDEQSADKAYAIKTATAKEEDLGAVIQDSDAQILVSTSRIGELGNVIAAKESEAAEANKVRKQDRADFQAKEKEILDSIDEFSRGVAQVKKQSAFLQAGRPGAQAALQHSQKMVDALSKLSEAEWVDAAGRKRLTKFLQTQDGSEDDLTLRQPQANVHSYESHSGGILGTLDDMLEKAQGTLSDTRKAEMKGQHTYEMLKLGLADEVKLNQRKLADGVADKAAASEAKAKAEGELAEVQKTKAADEEYKTTVELECKAKAEEWAARQASAQGEIAAVEKAKEILQSGVKAFVQVGQRSVKARRGDFDEDLESANRRARVTAVLNDLQKQFRSFKLVQIASAAKQDPFGKVRSLVEDMITKLVNEANEEASAKAFCDEETAKSTKSRDAKMMKLDKQQARIDDAATTKAELQEDIKTLQAELAESDKATAEATKIRNEENADYLVASKDYKDSANAVMAAISVLKSYYEGGAFIQKASKTGRSRQPAFGGARSDSGGSILEILEVAESDFTKLSMQTETEETEAAAAFEKLAQESAVTKTSKAAEVKGKEGEIKSIDVGLSHYSEDKATTGEELDTVLAYLAKLKPECASKSMSYEERKARREQEMEGLKNALSILEGTGVPAASLVQRHSSLRAGRSM